MKKNSVIFIISSLSGKGGMERVATLLASMLANEGNKITIITRDEAEDKCWFEIDSKVDIVKVQGKLPTFLKAVQRYVREEKVDHIVSHNMGKMTLALSILAYKKYGAKFVSFEHVANVTSPKYVQLLKRLLYLKVDKVVVLSKNDEKNYARFHQAVFRVNNPNPYSLKSSLRYKEDSKQIISIGRLTHQKGFDLLLKAWSKIENQYPDWTYEVYGDGEELERLERLKEELGVKRLFFKGFSNKLNEVYSQASFFVLSSRFEGFGMVLIEAHTFGLPTVSFNCPYGPSDIITDDYNGKLVADGDVLALAEAIANLIENPTKRVSMSKNATESVKTYSKENVINNWNTVFNG